VATALEVDVVELWCTANNVLSAITATNGGSSSGIEAWEHGMANFVSVVNRSRDFSR
jgi:hypothetical protein